ncbi:MAG: hypothetical protein KDD60_09165 [Bdellovibrionales bacterium]|nr:hypothetical protein [Bdellovibrionales bacterium]
MKFISSSTISLALVALVLLLQSPIATAQSGGEIQAEQTATLSGRVLDNKQNPIPTAHVSLNGIQTVPVNSMTGEFSVAVEVGKRYSLSFSNASHIFLHPHREFTVYGNREEIGIGYLK